MTRKNTLIDYANLGANLMQTVELSGLRRSVDNQNKMAATELAIEESQAKLRESIFQADTLLRNLQRAHARNHNVVGVMALAQESLVNLKLNPLSHLLRDYVDKERLRSVVEGFEALAANCSSSLSLAEQERGQLCAKYRAEESDLNAAISLSERREQVEEDREKLQKLEVQTAPNRRARKITTVASCIFLVGIVLLCAAIEDNGRHPLLQKFSFWVTGFAAGITMLAGLVSAATHQQYRSSIDPESGKQALSRNIITFEAALAACEVKTEWKNKSLAELKQTRQERVELMGRVLGQ